MKSTIMSLVASAIAIAVGISALPSQAQFDSNARSRQERRQAFVEALDLTESQQSQIQALRADLRSQLQGTLTAQQRATLLEARRSGQGRRAAMQALNLTESQRQQMRAARQSYRQQMQLILTEEQHQQLRQLLRQRRGDRPNR